MTFMTFSIRCASPDPAAIARALAAQTIAPSAIARAERDGEARAGRVDGVRLWNSVLQELRAASV